MYHLRYLIQMHIQLQYYFSPQIFSSQNTSFAGITVSIIPGATVAVTTVAVIPAPSVILVVAVSVAGVDLPVLIGVEVVIQLEDAVTGIPVAIAVVSSVSVTVAVVSCITTPLSVAIVAGIFIITGVKLLWFILILVH